VAGNGTIEFRFFFVAAVRNLLIFAEFVLKLQVHYVLDLEAIRPSILQ